MNKQTKNTLYPKNHKQIHITEETRDDCRRNRIGRYKLHHGDFVNSGVGLILCDEKDLKGFTQKIGMVIFILHRYKS